MDASEKALSRVIAHIHQGNARYRAKMEAAGVDPSSFRSLEDLARFPFTTKRDLIEAYPLGYLSVPKEKLARVHRSSGSAGFATLSAYTRTDLEAWSEVMQQALEGFGVTPSDVVMVTHGYGLFTGGLGVHSAAESLGCFVVPASTGNTVQQAALIQDLGVTVVVGTPSHILKLGHELAGRGRSLRLCICGAEPWSESLRAKIENLLLVEAFDLYGISEIIGPGVASERRGRKGCLTIWEDHFFPEIIDGELVLTTLRKEAMPLLRYRTGDRTAWAQSDGPYRAIQRISGRVDEMIKVKGVAFYPSEIENILLAQNGLNGHYVIELTRPEFSDVLTVRAEGLANPEEVARALKDKIGFRVEVQILKAGTLPANAGKAKRFRDLRP